MTGAVGANPCVRPCIPGRHRGLPLQHVPKAGNLFLVKSLHRALNAGRGAPTEKLICTHCPLPPSPSLTDQISRPVGEITSTSYTKRSPASIYWQGFFFSSTSIRTMNRVRAAPYPFFRISFIMDKPILKFGSSSRFTML